MGVTPIWTAKDGVLTFDPELLPKGDYIHDIVTDNTYKSFQLSIEWNISEGGNSGIFWGVQEGETHNKPYSTGPEIQVLDNERHPDAKANPNFTKLVHYMIWFSLQKMYVSPRVNGII